MRRFTVAAAVGVATIAIGACGQSGVPAARVDEAKRPGPAPAPKPTTAPAPSVVAAPATPPLPAVDPNELGEGNSMLAPVRYQNLTLFPVVASGEVDPTDYLVLDEGMKSRKVRIRELGDDDDAEVNELTLTNRSSKPLFVMAGEVVIGGKQDRIIGKTTIVPPKKTQTIPVFCVERGRWEGRHADFRSAGALAHSKLRQKASYEGQGDVWNEVADKNAKRHLENDTDTYRATAAQQATGTAASWATELEQGLAAIPQPMRQRMVGYVVALNGEVVSIDVFGSPALFAKLDRKLRRSYFAEAIDQDVIANAPTPSGDDVRAFLEQADSARDEKVYESDEADTVNNIGAKAASTKVMSKRTPGGKPVYKSVTKYEQDKPAPKQAIRQPSLRRRP